MAGGGAGHGQKETGTFSIDSCAPRYKHVGSYRAHWQGRRRRPLRSCRKKGICPDCRRVIHMGVLKSSVEAMTFAFSVAPRAAQFSDAAQ